MAQARTPAGSGAGTGTGSEQTGGENTTLNAPQALVFDEVPGVTNVMGDGQVHLQIIDGTLFSGTVQATSSDWVYSHTMPENGRIVGLMYENGSVAADGTNGWELDFLNLDQGSESSAYFGIGSGTEAAKGTDNDVAVAASETTFISNSLTTGASHFNKGDVLQCTADRDGTTIVGSFVLVVSYESQGHV